MPRILMLPIFRLAPEPELNPSYKTLDEPVYFEPSDIPRACPICNHAHPLFNFCPVDDDTDP